MPSQATSLPRRTRASLNALGAKWELGDAAAPIGRSDRARLEELSRGFRQAMAVPSISTLTANALRARRHEALENALVVLSEIYQRHRTLNAELESKQSEVGSYKEKIRSIEKWNKYCEAGAPDLITSLGRIEKQIGDLHASLGGLTVDSIPEFPPEYASRTIDDALKAAEANLSAAQERERSGINSLKQREEIGQSLQSLRSELRDIATAIIQRTGDSAHCPICKQRLRAWRIIGKDRRT